MHPNFSISPSCNPLMVTQIEHSVATSSSLSFFLTTVDHLFLIVSSIRWQHVPPSFLPALPRHSFRCSFQHSLFLVVVNRDGCAYWKELHYYHYFIWPIAHVAWVNNMFGGFAKKGAPDNTQLGDWHWHPDEKSGRMAIWGSVVCFASIDARVARCGWFFRDIVLDIAMENAKEPLKGVWLRGTLNRESRSSWVAQAICETTRENTRSGTIYMGNTRQIKNKRVKLSINDEITTINKRDQHHSWAIGH